MTLSHEPKAGKCCLGSTHRLQTLNEINNSDQRHPAVGGTSWLWYFSARLLYRDHIGESSQQEESSQASNILEKIPIFGTFFIHPRGGFRNEMSIFDIFIINFNVTED